MFWTYVTTKHYGEQFKSEFVEQKLLHAVSVYPPASLKKNRKVTLHFKVEKVSMTGLTGLSEDRVSVSGLYTLDDGQTSAYTNFTPPGSVQHLEHLRDVSTKDIDAQILDIMPGFKLSWWYTGANVTPDNKYKNDVITQQFIR